MKLFRQSSISVTKQGKKHALCQGRYWQRGTQKHNKMQVANFYLVKQRQGKNREDSPNRGRQKLKVQEIRQVKSNQGKQNKKTAGELGKTEDNLAEGM